MGKNGFVCDIKVPCRLSYVNIKEKTSFKESKPKYKLTCIVSKGDKETIKKLNDAAKEAVIKTFGPEKNDWPPVFTEEGAFTTSLSKTGKDGWFLRDGDYGKSDKSPENKGCVFFTCSNMNSQPKVFKRLESGKVMPNVPVETVYSGCYATVMIDVAGFNGDSQGVTAYLKGVCFEKDGEPLSGGKELSDDAFGEVETDSDDPNNYAF